jgi:hypothetical protein
VIKNKKDGGLKPTQNQKQIIGSQMKNLKPFTHKANPKPKQPSILLIPKWQQKEQKL